MRRILLILMMPVIFLTGCLSQEDKDFFLRQGEMLEARIADYEVLLDETEATITDVKARIESKDIDVGVGLALINDAKSQFAGYKRMIEEDRDRLSRIDDKLDEKSTAEKWEAVGLTLAGIAASLIGVRIQRGASSKVHKTDDGRLMDSGRARSG